MAISFISAASYAATTGAMPTHAAGDLILLFAYRDGNTTAPVLQAGWTAWPSAPTGSGNTQSARLSYKVAASGSETTGTWALATGIVIMVYRGAYGPRPFGGGAWGTGTGATITYPALTPTFTDGTSWGVRFAGHRNATNLTTNAPSTVPNTARTGVATEARGLDSNAGLSAAITDGTQSTNGSTGWEARTVELYSKKPAISTLTDDFDTGSAPDAAKWSFGGSTALSGGAAVMPTSSDTLDSLRSGAAGYYDLTSDAAYFQVKSAGTNGEIDVRSSFAVAGGISSFVFNSSSNVEVYVDGTPTGITRTHTNGDWYRIRESAGTRFWDYSTDGTNWTNLHSLGGMADDARSLVRVTANGPLTIDNFNVVPSAAGTIGATGQKATAAFTAAQEQTGAIAASLPPAAAAFSGEQPESGAIASSLPPAVAAATGLNFIDAAGTIASAPPPATFTSTGAQAQTGTVASTATPAAAAASGAQEQTGTITSAAQPAVAAVAGTGVETGTITSAAAPAVFAGSATHEQTGTIAAALPPAVGALAGVEQPAGVIAAAAKSAAFAATGAQAQTSAIDSTAQKTVAALTGVMQPAGTIASALPPAVFVGTAAQAQTAAIASAAQPAVAAVVAVMHPSGSIAAVALPALFMGSGAQEQTGVIAATAARAAAALAGFMAPAGTIASALPPAVFAATAAHTQSGTIVAVGQRPTAVFTGLMQPSGIIAVTAQRATATLAGTQEQAGTIVAVATRTIAAFTGFEEPSGAINSTTRVAVFAATGIHGDSGTITSVAAPAFAAFITGPVLYPPVFPTRAPAPPGALTLKHQIISLHTMSGIQLYQFGPEDQVNTMWTRDLRDVSRCELTIPPGPDLDLNRMPDIVYWAHWISVWDGDRDTLLWTGPIQNIRCNPNGLSLSCRDHSAFLARTRVPITKRWDAADPAWIAGELWDAMIDHHGLNMRPIVRPDPEGDRFDYRVVTDAQMLDQTIADLVQLGLRYTDISGIPIIGPMPLDPIATLAEHDFIGDPPDLVRDGAAAFNDVLVRGPDNLARAHTDMQGLNLQTIVNVDNMFGVSNVTSAAQQYARHTASIRTTLELPSGTRLHPEAPVSIDQLIPSTRFVVEAYGIRQLMELQTVEVTADSSGVAVKVSMDQVPDKIELADLTENQRPSIPALGGANR